MSDLGAFCPSSSYQLYCESQALTGSFCPEQSRLNNAATKGAKRPKPDTRIICDLMLELVGLQHKASLCGLHSNKEKLDIRNLVIIRRLFRYHASNSTCLNNASLFFSKN